PGDVRLGRDGERQEAAGVVEAGPAEGRAGDGLQVQAVEGGDVLLDREQLQRPGACGGPEAFTARGVAQQGDARLRERPRIARRYDESGAADDLHDGADVRGDRRPSAEHRLDETDGEALDDAGQHGDGAGGVGVGRGGQVGPADLLEGDGV